MDGSTSPGGTPRVPGRTTGRADTTSSSARRDGPGIRAGCATGAATAGRTPPAAQAAKAGSAHAVQGGLGSNGAEGGAGQKIDTSRADPARRYDYWLGGKDNFEPDRVSGDLIAQHFPTIRVAAVENRGFLRRAVTALAKAGVDQFLDIGTGIPTSPNVHQVAHKVNPRTRVVYVDNSPLVLVHARALMVADPGATPPAYVEADLRDPAGILAAAREHLDFTRPIGLLLIAVLHFLTDDDQAHAVVAELVDALPHGSWLALSHLTGDLLDDKVRDQFEPINTAAGITMAHRSQAQIERFAAGLEVAEPGVVPVNRWRAEAEPSPRPSDTDTAVYGLLAHKP